MMVDFQKLNFYNEMNSKQKIFVKCDCGCGRFFLKETCQIRQSRYNFLDLQHCKIWRRGRRSNGKFAKSVKLDSGDRLEFGIKEDKIGFIGTRYMTEMGKTR